MPLPFEMSDYVGECWANSLSALGAIVAGWLALKFACSLWNGMKTFMLARILGLSLDLKKMGRWAVVTGATDGIGKAYAHELAHQGLDIILISRNPDKLSDVAQEIESKHKAKTKTVAVDFTKTDIYEKIGQELENKEIGVLVNNVGMSYNFPQYYAEVENDKRCSDIVSCNVTSVAMMTRLVLSAMVERKKGVIINISSASAIKPTALLTHYSATKAYVDVFSEALQHEYKSQGIIVQCVKPFLVATKLSKIRRTSWFVPSPATYARAALGTVGLQQRTYGCISHALQGWIAEMVPKCLFNYVSDRQHLDIRKRALRKK